MRITCHVFLAPSCARRSPQVKAVITLINMQQIRMPIGIVPLKKSPAVSAAPGELGVPLKKSPAVFLPPGRAMDERGLAF